MRRSAAVTALALALLLGVPTVGAHYFWLQPERYRVIDGHTLAVRLFQGHPGEPKGYPYVPFAFKRFAAVGPKGGVAIKCKLNAEPAGRIVLNGKGVHVLVYRSRFDFTQLEAAKFHKHLREKGLEHIIKARVRRGEANADGKESFARNCKSLIRVGNSARGYRRRVNLPLELTPLDNPFRARRYVRFVLELHGRPHRGARVELFRLEDKHKTALSAARTDARGRVRLRIPKAGSWMVTAVYMTRAKKPVAGDWQSYWANLTFEAR